MSHPPRPIALARAPLRALLKRLRQSAQSDRVVRFVALLAAGYLRFVGWTSRIVFEPDNPFVATRHQLPVVGTTWHSHLFLLPFVRTSDHPVSVLISTHSDGTFMAAVAERFGVGTVRGSGGRANARWVEKGAVTGFLGLRASLDEGSSVCMTADISNAVAGRAGPGIIALARVSGRPIIGLGFAVRRRIRVNSWDRSVIPLPFCRMACVTTPAIEVPRGAGEAVLEEKRRDLEDALNAATDRAYEIVGGRPA